MKSVKLCVVLGSLATAGVLVFLLRAPGAGQRTDGQRTLVLYCAAGMKPPIAELVKNYEDDLGITIQTQYGGSGTLLSNLRVAPTGDLYVAADASYIRIAREQGLVAEAIPLATQRPIIAVAKGNPKQIRSVQDLLRDDVRVSLGNPDAASIGKQTQIALTKAGLWESLQRAVQARGVFKPTVNNVANDIKIGTVDAGVIWDSTAGQYPELEIAAPLTDDPNFVMEITIGVLRSCRQPARALQFARYLSAPETGRKTFERYYYTAADGDAWAKEPEILLCCGDANRPALDDTLRAFEQREGCKIDRMPDDWDSLAARMKAGEAPDAYLACDASFLDRVQEHLSLVRLDGADAQRVPPFALARDSQHKLLVRRLFDTLVSARSQEMHKAAKSQGGRSGQA